MRIGVAALLGVLVTGPAMAQSLGDIGRALTDQVAPRQNPAYPAPSGRESYEQGRRDQEEQTRRDARRSDEGTRYRDDRDDRRRADDREDRRRVDDAQRRERDDRRDPRDRPLDDQRPRGQSGRY